MASARAIVPFGVLGLIGFSVRVTLLAVPPLLPLIKADLGLTNTEVAALTTLPVLLFAVGAGLGSGIVWRIGARGTVLAGLLLAGLASAGRGAVSGTAALFAFTVIMGLGIAAIHPAVPSLVRSLVPEAVHRGTAVYVGGLLLSEAAAASLTLPFLLPLVGSWEAALAAWSVIVLATALVVGTVRIHGVPDASDTADPTEAARGWMPSLGERRTWRLGLLQGAGSVAYFASNAVFPVYLHARGRGDLVGWTLAALNTTQLLAPVVVGALPLRVSAGAVATRAAGVAVVVGAIGMVTAPALAATWAGLIGFCAAYLLIVALALPAVLVGGREIARLSAGMFTIGYGLAFVVPLAGGALWDATGSSWAAIAPVAAAGLGAVLVGGRSAEPLRTGTRTGRAAS